MSGAVDLDNEPLLACVWGCFRAAGLRSFRFRGGRGFEVLGLGLELAATGGNDAGTKVGASASSCVSWPPKALVPATRGVSCAGRDVLGGPLLLDLCPRVLGPAGRWVLGGSIVVVCGRNCSRAVLSSVVEIHDTMKNKQARSQ